MASGRSRLLDRRSHAEWCVRIGLALAAVLLGYASVTYSMAMVTLRTSPAQAHGLAPRNARVSAALATIEFAADQSSAAWPRIDALARQALRRDALAVQAVVTLGLHAQTRGDTAAARRFFAYAETLSRRELQTQLWAIEDAIGRGEITQALHQYDIALRTSNLAPDLLFPVLGSAIAEPQVRAGLVATLSRRPLWANEFVDYVANTGKSPENTVLLLAELRRSGIVVSPDATRVVITRLVQAGAPMLAWKYYSSVRPTADRRRSRDPQFSAQLTQPTPFDWVIADGQNVSASIERDGGRGFVSFNIPASVGGDIVQQLQFLPPGQYKITGHTSKLAGATRSSLYWALNCWKGREIARVPLPNAPQGGGAFSGTYTVPVNCPVQMLTLSASPSDDVNGLSGEIDQARLTPIE